MQGSCFTWNAWNRCSLREHRPERVLDRRRARRTRRGDGGRAASATLHGDDEQAAGRDQARADAGSHSGGSQVARDTAASKVRSIASSRRCSGSRLGATSRFSVCRNATFLATASTQVTAARAGRSARTAPGKPAPLPTSISVAAREPAAPPRGCRESAARPTARCSVIAVRLILAIPRLQQREVSREPVDLRAVERDAERARSGNQPLFRCLVQARSVLFRTMPHLSPRRSRAHHLSRRGRAAAAAAIRASRRSPAAPRFVATTASPSTAAS